jgi:hypothetical protein
MKRVIIVVEGETEEEFVKTTLRPFLNGKGIFDVSAIKIQTSKGRKGGFVNYQHLKNDVRRLLKEPNVVVSTFVDFFRIPTDVPGYEKLSGLRNADDKIDVLQAGMSEDIHDRHFLPYIQKFEFEALLFSSNEGFEEMYDTPAIHAATKRIIAQYDNPEEINDGPDTAPSKRLEKILAANGEKYSKIVAGNLIAGEIGIEVILEKCPRFKAWVDELVAAASLG